MLVIVPTYNERDNLPRIVERLRSALPDADLLVADDNSPDGTGKIADEIAERDDHVHVPPPPGQAGPGRRLHRRVPVGPRPRLRRPGGDRRRRLPPARGAPQAARGRRGGADLAIGSRWVPGGKVINWPTSREFLSRGANTYTRIMLGMPVRDATAGFRAYRATTLRKIGIEGVQSQGYCFQVDLTLRTVREGLRITEVPITFVERAVGQSKMSRDVMTEALWRISVWGVTGLPGSGSGGVGVAPPRGHVASRGGVADLRAVLAGGAQRSCAAA